MSETPERVLLRETVRRFVKTEVLPHLDAWEREGELPRSYLRDAEIERHYRDVRILAIGGGADEILTALAARRLGYTA
ncbi:alkylation response protein AidB-like acyl-CoA dehydrogenase [Streptacidiphilus sp. MAP12-33]|uniref:acyl-CoA dehydrogenase family protein n=1 Tax=Streptacidiphilus sp. MAP12-33 TaxID=3156266 RepID=UPI003515551A